MKQFPLVINRSSHKNGRSFLSYFRLVSVLFLLVGCGWDPLGLGNLKIDDAINEIDKTRQTIQGESSGWRDELPKLVDSLNGTEAQASGDVKGIVAEAANQASELSSEAINLSDNAAKDVVAAAGAEFRCNADFLKTGTLTQLQYLVDDLKFWKINQKHLDKKPAHAVCAILPSALSLSQSGNTWLVVPAPKNPTGSLVHVYGYNFRGDALPRLQLQNGNGTPIGDVSVTPSYVTHYQIDLNFATANFSNLQPGPRVVFRWPDLDDPNTISLLLASPAQLKITSPVSSPASPIAGETLVTLRVTITNNGGSASGSFVVSWLPDPLDPQPRSIPVTLLDQLNPGDSRNFTFPGYVYKRAGLITGSVYLSNGTESLSPSVAVQPPNPVLQKAVVNFNSLDDGRDHDTLLDIQIVRANGTIIARGQGPDQEFKAHQSNQVELPIVNGPVKKSDLVNSTIKIHIQPNGNDVWRFNWQLFLTFSDNSNPLLFDFNNAQLTENPCCMNTQQPIPIKLP